MVKRVEKESKNYSSISSKEIKVNVPSIKFRFNRKVLLLLSIALLVAYCLMVFLAYLDAINKIDYSNSQTYLIAPPAGLFYFFSFALCLFSLLISDQGQKVFSTKVEMVIIYLLNPLFLIGFSLIIRKLSGGIVGQSEGTWIAYLAMAIPLLIVIPTLFYKPIWSKTKKIIYSIFTILAHIFMSLVTYVLVGLSMHDGGLS